MGANTKKTEAAAPAASVTTTPVVEVPATAETATAVAEETIAINFYNEALAIADGQGKRIVLLESENLNLTEAIIGLQAHLRTADDKVAELEAEKVNGMQSIADLFEKLNQAESTVCKLAHEIEYQKRGKLVLKNAEESAEHKTSFDYNGRTYGFKENTPATLFHDDRLYTQDELLNDAEAMTTLIVGENGFIKQIH